MKNINAYDINCVKAVIVLSFQCLILYKKNRIFVKHSTLYDNGY